MMATISFNSRKLVVLSWIYAGILITVIIVLAGKQAISAFLLKLYEFFIQKNPARP